MRINKYLSNCGLCSRREADRLLAAGRVSVQGKTAEPGMQVEAGMQVCVDGRPVEPLAEKTYLKLYKPRGIVCTADAREKNNVLDYVQYPVRLTYAGRLDRQSEGLLLLTNDGDLIEALMRSGNAHEKEYLVQLTRELTKEELQRLQEGIYLTELEQRTRPCQINALGNKQYRFLLTQGLNRQIRRMCRELGVGVRSLMRVRIASLQLGALPYGQWKALTEQEITALRQEIEKKQQHKGGKQLADQSTK